MYYLGAVISGPYIGVDFEPSNSLVLQDSLCRLRPSHLLDLIGLRFRAQGHPNTNSLLCFAV